MITYYDFIYIYIFVNAFGFISYNNVIFGLFISPDSNEPVIVLLAILALAIWTSAGLAGMVFQLGPFYIAVYIDVAIITKAFLFLN